MSQAKRWVFTLNNHTLVEVDSFRTWASTNPEYAVIGFEHGEQGTPHLQGFLCLKRKRRLQQVKLIPGLSRAHFEVARGTAAQASLYCKKEGQYEEFGVLPAGQQGKRTDWDVFKEWCEDRDGPPTDRETAQEFPSLFARYPRACRNFIDMFCPKRDLAPPDAPLRDWQRDLYNMLLEPADDRKIIFVVDNEGNVGKSWFIRYMLTKHPQKVQRLSCGKRDDLAYAVDPSKSVFLFDIPREQLEFMQYSVLEQLKDGLIFSSKYESQTKVLFETPHVVVMTNEAPDMAKLSADRYVMINL